MAFDPNEFDSIDDVDIEFKKRLRKAPDEEAEAAVRAEWSEGKAAFWQNQSQKQALAGAKRDALDKYPLAKKFADDIRGNTPAEIEASAKRFSAVMEEATKEAEDAKKAVQDAEATAVEAAQQRYGAPAGAASGAINRPNAQTAKQEAIARVHEKLQRGEGLQHGRDKMDVITMGNERLREAIDFQRLPHPELGLGMGGSYKGESAGNPLGQPVVNALVDARKQQTKR